MILGYPSIAAPEILKKWKVAITSVRQGYCYDLKPLELGKRTNSCIRVNIRELDRELFTK